MQAVFVDGEEVVRGGRSSKVDEAKLFDAAREAAAAVALRIGLDARPRWPQQ